MSFDIGRFDREKFTPRTEDVPVPELAEYFDENEPQVWTVRCLNGEELSVVHDSMRRAATVEGVVDALTEGMAPAVAVAMRDLLGRNASAGLAKNIDLLHLGTVKPKIDRPQAVKLLQLYPEVGIRLAVKVYELTGMGHQPGK